jgi:hypothetical protein
MLEITGTTADYRQKMFINITNFGAAELVLQFKPNQYAWYFDLTWQEFSVKNQQLTMSANILRQYKNILPFGIMCFNNSTIDPIVVEAFVLDTKLYLLDSAEVVAIEADLYGS